MKSRMLFFSIVFSIVMAACNVFSASEKPQQNPKIIELSAAELEVVNTANEFGVGLFTNTARLEKGNMMLSPLSAGVALNMLLNGSNGDTYEQIKTMLGFSEEMDIDHINATYKNLMHQLFEADKRVIFNSANAVFYKNNFNVQQPFLETLHSAYDAEIEGLDFSAPAAVERVNKWASDQTNKKIPKVIDNISDEMVMFLMNAIYFKGAWSEEFDKANTTGKPFQLESGSTIQVSTMNGKVSARRYQDDHYAAIELPYGRKNYSMVIIVPHSTLNEFYEGFTSETWRTLTGRFDASNDWGQVTVNLPKFKFEYEVTLNDILSNMGMIDAFLPEKADLSKINPDIRLNVDFVKQNTFVEVNEEGTEAAAVTTIGIEMTSLNEFNVNRPFIFAIRERTSNTLIFMGQVMDPSI